VDGQPRTVSFNAPSGSAQSERDELAVDAKGQRRELTAKMVRWRCHRQKLGASVQEMTQELADNFGYHRRDGVLIAEVDADGPAARADLKAGYLLAGIDGQPTPTCSSARAS